MPALRCGRGHRWCRPAPGWPAFAPLVDGDHDVYGDDPVERVHPPMIGPIWVLTPEASVAALASMAMSAWRMTRPIGRIASAMSRPGASPVRRAER
ncbi:hypothetical protein NKG94_15115 [Micromonospora sp. M12]